METGSSASFLDQMKSSRARKEQEKKGKDSLEMSYNFIISCASQEFSEKIKKTKEC